MVNIIKSVDEEGFTTRSRRRSRPIEEKSSDAKLGDRNNIKVERKVIGASMGKKGNDYGEYIRLQVSHNKAFPDTLFFPAGNNGVGWWNTGVFLENLIASVSHIKERKVPENSVLPSTNVWIDSNRNNFSRPKKGQNQLSSIIPKSDHDLLSIWKRSLVVELASVHDFDWKEVGKWLMVKFGWSLGFELQPIDDHKAVFNVNTFSEFSRIKNIGSWKVGSVDVKIYPWFTEINAIPKPNLENIRKQWVGIKGVPYNLWNFSTFKSIGDKFGGLNEVSPESSMATDLSEIRVSVLGPVSKGVWCEELILNNSRVWVEIRLIGEVLEPSRQEMKPVSISIDRMEPPPGKFWRRKSTTANSSKEDAVSIRGDNVVVDPAQRESNHGFTTEGAGLSVGTDLGGPSLRCQAPSVSYSSDSLSHPPGFGPSSNFSTSVGQGSSLRSLRKKVKSKQLSKECMDTCFTSASLQSNNMDANDANGSGHEVSKAGVNSDNDDAASHTSGSARMPNNTSGDAMSVAKGIADKFNILFGKLKSSGHSSGI
ncbi:hypothetical protein MKW94_013887, partial [Papaver nudicaule]|nr:hypothetical protein [Papaver nudicaule]